MLFRTLSKITLILIAVISNLACGQEKISNSIAPKQYFIGRELELEKIKRAFNDGEIIVSIAGIAGIGKTELGRKFVELNQDNYDIIWTFDVNNDLHSQFQVLAKNINQRCNKNNENCVDEDIARVIDGVLDYLALQKKWLLVFDNIQIGQTYKVKHIIEKEYKYGNLIFISQDKAGLVNTIPLKQMSKKESSLLIDKVALNLSKETKESIGNEFAGYPLSIITTIKFLEQNTYVNFDEYKKIKYSYSSNDKLQKVIRSLCNNLSEDEKNFIIKCALMDNQHLSKSLLLKINDNINLIYKLNEYSLLVGTEISTRDPKKVFFEMHDIIKNNILNSVDHSKIEENLEDSIRLINNIFPEDLSLYSDLIEKNPYITENLEKLLENAELYNVKLADIMEIRKNLLILYIRRLDYNNAKRMVEWLIEHEHQVELIIRKSSKRYQEAYVLFNVYKGVYWDFAYGDAQKALESLERAISILEELYFEESFHLKFTAYAQLAQTLIYIGDIERAKTILTIAESYLIQLKNEGDWGLLWFLKAKILLELGLYDESLQEVIKEIEFENRFQDVVFTAPAKLLKAEILAKISKTNEAYEESSEVYNSTLNYIKDDHELKARIFMILGLVMLKQGDLNKAQGYIEQAKNIFVNLTYNKKEELSTDDNLAQTLILEGELKYCKKQYDEAIELYNQGKKILERRYGNNLKNDSYSLLLKNLIATYIKNEEKDNAQLYQELHDTIFSASHFRTKEIYKLVYGN